MPGVLITGMLQFFIPDTCWPQWNPRTEGDDLKPLTEKRATSSQSKERINTGVKAGLWPLLRLGAWGKHMRWFTAGQDSLNQKGSLKEADSTFLCSVVCSREQAGSAFGGLFCPRQSQKGWNDPKTRHRRYVGIPTPTGLWLRKWGTAQESGLCWEKKEKGGLLITPWHSRLIWLNGWECIMLPLFFSPTCNTSL